MFDNFQVMKIINYIFRKLSGINNSSLLTAYLLDRCLKDTILNPRSAGLVSNKPLGK